MSHEKWLRQAAAEIAAAGHNGWGNTCTQAADAIAKLQAELLKKEEELAIVNKLLDTRNELLELIPGCEAHGDQCVPHAMEWVTSIKSWKESALRYVQHDERCTVRKTGDSGDCFCGLDKLLVEQGQPQPLPGGPSSPAIEKAWNRFNAEIAKPHCKCSFTDSDGTVVPGEPCEIHPKLSGEQP